jgi:identified by metaGeneAnnotator
LLPPNGNGNNGNGGHTPVPDPADGRISVSGRLDNSGTIEAGGRTDLNVHSELANSGRLTLGSLKTEGGRFDNRQGTILARSADISSRHTDNRGGALAAGSLKLDGTRLDNRQGVIRSNTLSDIRLSDGLNNQQPLNNKEKQMSSWQVFRLPCLWGQGAILFLKCPKHPRFVHLPPL